MIRGRTIARAIAALALAGVALLATLIALHPLDRTPIASRGGRVMSIAAIATPRYMQTDRRWGTQMLGSTVEPMAASGCTVCCVSMALAHFGVDIDPGELNRRLVRSNGFTIQGWLKWSWVGKLTGGRFVAEVSGRPEHATIDDALERGWPAVVRIRLRGEVPHWVLVVAKDGAEYLARDPLVDRPLVALSSRSPIIEAIRVVRPAS